MLLGLDLATSGFYGQRPVPLLGGGPGYGAEAGDCWIIDEVVLEKVRSEGVLLPTLDIGKSWRLLRRQKTRAYYSNDTFFAMDGTMHM